MAEALAAGGVSSVPVGTLLWTVFESIIEVFLLCLAGYTLARVGIIDKATQRKINVVQVTLLTPCLMTSKIAFSLTPEKLKEMWIIPLGFVVVSSVSAGVAFAMSKLFRLSKSQRAFAMAASMFQNSNSLPIALIGSLVIEVPGLKWGHDDSKDQMLGRALTYLVVYSTLGMMASALRQVDELIADGSQLQLRWSYGVKLLSQADDEVPPQSDSLPVNGNGNGVAGPQGSTAPTVQSPGEMAPPAAMETDPIHSSMDEMRRETQDEAERERTRSRTASKAVSSAWRAETVSAHSLHPVHNGVSPIVGSPTQVDGFEEFRRNSSGLGKRRSSSNATARPRRPTRTESGREFWGLPEAAKTPRSLSDQEEASESEDERSSDEEWGDSNLPGNIHRRRRQLHTPPHSRLGSVLRKTKTKTKAILSTINQFMTVPMYASIASVVIALIPPLQSVLGKTKPLVQAIKSAGQCSIPMTLVVLGAFFYTPPAPPQEGKQGAQPAAATADNKASFLQRKLEQIRHPKASTTHPGENRAVFVAVVSRMIIVPALLLPFLAWIAVEDWFEAAEDPVFILAATLLISSPPALTLAQITQAASGDAFERLISKTISWSYAVLTPPLTLLYVVLGLLFGRL